MVDPYNSVHNAGNLNSLATTEWEIPPNLQLVKLQDAARINNRLGMFCFTNGNLIDYFTVQTATDGLPRGDFKSINRSALDMFRCGHVHEIKIGYEKYIYMQAKCWAEMKKSVIYKISLCLDEEVYDVVGAKCGCPAGKGPTGSCKHIAAVCYALEEFSCFGQLPEFLTSTDRQQEWHRPHLGKLNIVPVHQLNKRRSEILKQSTKGLSMFDPRQPEDRQLNNNAIEQLRCELLDSNHPCLLLDILIPSVDKITHDHCYSLPPGQCLEETVSTSLQAISREDDSDDDEICIPEEDGQDIDYMNNLV